MDVKTRLPPLAEIEFYREHDHPEDSKISHRTEASRLGLCAPQRSSIIENRVI